MRKKIFASICIFACLCFSVVNARNNNILKGKKIIIDPGHGGIDPGTVYNELYEKNLNLRISLLLKEELEKNQVHVLMTRDGDYDLASPKATFRKKSDFDNRIELINNSHSDLYLSIHMNYLNDATYFGPQVFYTTGNEILADIVQKNLNKNVGSNRNIKIIAHNIYMYQRINIKGLLIECGFLSNQTERLRLEDTFYQHKLVKAIVDGLKVYFTHNK